MKFIPNYCCEILNRIKTAGFEAYAVGGCVRDALMGKTSNDVDITTSATPEEIEGLFEKTVRTGGRFYTVTVWLNEKTAEITPFRKENGYSDGRRPDNVQFASSLTDDLLRRDFTINAICFDGEKIIDPLHGRNDLQSRIIRTVGDADTRFSEDALRILRAFRFSATLGFDIEKTTLDAALRNAQLLKRISEERITEELVKILLSDAPEVLSSLLNVGALEFLRLSFSDNLASLRLLKKEKITRLAAFFELCGRDAPSLLPFSRSEKRSIRSVFDILDNFPNNNKTSVKRILRNYEASDFLAAVEIADIIRGNKSDCEKLFREIITNNEPYRINHLAVRGKDLLERGILDKEIGNTLDSLLEYVIENPDKNEKNTLLSKIR